MSSLGLTRRRLRTWLISLPLSEIRALFDAVGVSAPEPLPRRRGDLVDSYYSHIDWAVTSDVDKFLKLVDMVLRDLSRRNREDLAVGQDIRKVYRLLREALDLDGAEIGADGVPRRSGGPVVSARPRRRAAPVQSSGNPGLMDALFLSALTEEHQVVKAVMTSYDSEPVRRGDVTLYSFPLRGVSVAVGVASAHAMGAVDLGVFATLLFSRHHARRAVLLGIAAAVDIEDLELCDVPVADEVLKMDDIAVASGELDFRTRGFPVDSKFLHAIGELRSDGTSYSDWRDSCQALTGSVSEAVNALRTTKLVAQRPSRQAALVVGPVAGGPFLIRDSSFRDSLRGSHKNPVNRGSGNIPLSQPIHPKLLSVEMESHGFMRAAHSASIPAAVLKGISDNGDEDKRRTERESGGFYRFQACLNATQAALHTLGLLCRA